MQPQRAFHGAARTAAWCTADRAYRGANHQAAVGPPSSAPAAGRGAARYPAPRGEWRPNAARDTIYALDSIKGLTL